MLGSVFRKNFLTRVWASEKVTCRVGVESCIKSLEFPEVNNSYSYSRIDRPEETFLRTWLT